MQCTCKVRAIVTLDGIEQSSLVHIEKWDPACLAHSTAKVILFKESGKYYTEERWAIPKDSMGPWDMERSKDFHRIGDGAVLVPTQEPWGFPQLLPY